MAEGPYRFFRGTCHLFFEDLVNAAPLPDSPLVWMCGDLHVENLGTYKGDNRLVYFDLNDFDEALLGPACWELVRMVTSIFVVFDHLEMEAKKAQKWANLFLETYSKTIQKGKTRYIEPRTAEGIVKKFLDSVSKRKQKTLIAKYLYRRKTRLGFSVDNLKLFKLEKKLKKELKEHITDWIKNSNESPYNYKVLDVCFRVAGTGSVGVKRYLFLLESRKIKRQYLLLDMKEATPSSLIPFIKVRQPEWQSEAERIVCIQDRVQNISPALLSATIFKNDPYVIQEMQPVEDKVDLNLIKYSYRNVCEVIRSMALLTASAHLRSCSRQGSASADHLIQFGKSDHWQTDLIKYANEYATSVTSDYKAFLKEFEKDGRIVDMGY